MRRPESDDTRVGRVQPSPPGAGQRRVVPVAPGTRRRRVVPVADLLAREGRPLDVDGDFLFTDALVSVRRGMAGLAAGLLVVVGGASVVGQLLGSDTGDRAGSDDGRSTAQERTARPAATSTIGIDVADVASRTRPTAGGRGGAGGGQAGAGEGRSAQDVRSASPTPRTTSATPSPAPRPTTQQRTPSGGGDQSDEYREWSGDYGRKLSGDYGREWSGNYGTDYWGG